MITYLIKPLLYYFCCCPNPQRAIADLEQDQPFQDALELIIQKKKGNSTPIFHADAIPFIPGTLEHTVAKSPMPTFEWGIFVPWFQYYALKWIRNYEASRAFSAIFQTSNKKVCKKLRVSLLLGEEVDKEILLYDPFILKETMEYTYYTTRDQFLLDFVSFPYLQLQRYCEWYNRYGVYLVFLCGLSIARKCLLHLSPSATFHIYTVDARESKPRIARAYIPLFYSLLRESADQFKEKLKTIMISCQKERDLLTMQKIELDQKREVDKLRLSKQQYTEFIKSTIDWFDKRMLNGIQENKNELIVPSNLSAKLPSLLKNYPYFDCQGISTSSNHTFDLATHLDPVIDYIRSSTSKEVHNRIQEICFSHKWAVISNFFISSPFIFLGILGRKPSLTTLIPCVYVYYLLAAYMFFRSIGDC